MGTFLYEYVNQPHFENENELKLRLKDILLDFGEAGLVNVSINNRKSCLLRLNELSLPEADGTIELSYNRFEKDRWEPSFVNFEEDKFTGIRSWAIGSKIGYSYHYDAMLIARVLCECYSNGTYMVYGDVGYSGILQTLTYIGNRYGFEIVEKFVKNRCNLQNFDMKDEKCPIDSFWGKRDSTFYYREFMASSSFKDWLNISRDEEDLKNAEKGENIVYCYSEYYLGILLLYHMLSRDLKGMDYPNEKELYDLFLKYGGRIEAGEYMSYLNDLPEDIMKYKGYYSKYFYTENNLLSDPDLIQKCILFIQPSIGEVLNKAKEKFLNYYASDENFKIMAENEKEIYARLLVNRFVHESGFSGKSGKEREEEICGKIKEIMERMLCTEGKKTENEKDYIRELYRCTGKSLKFSDGLDSRIKRLFSGDEYTNFVSNWKFESKSTKEILDRLFDIMDILFDKNNVLMIEEFFYKMIEASHNQEFCFRLDLLWHLLKSTDDSNEQFIMNWVLEIDALYEKYVKDEGCVGATIFLK